MTARAEFLTPRELARAIGVSEASVKRWCDLGFIETSRTTGGHRRLGRSSVDDFLNRTGRQPLEPESVRPQLSGWGERTLARGGAAFLKALAHGSERVALQIVKDLHAAGHSFSEIADNVILPAEQQILSSSDTAILPRQTVTEVCLGIVDALQVSRENALENAPLAFAGALDGARSTLPVALAVLVLREAGWKADSLGAGLPFATLRTAVRQHQPRFLVLQVDEVRNPLRFEREWIELLGEADKAGTRLLATGRGLLQDPEVGANAMCCLWCNTFRSLQVEAESRRSATRPSPGE